MRKFPKPTEQEINEGPQKVSFEIANGNARRQCVLHTLSQRVCRRRSTVSRIGQPSKRCHTTLSGRGRIADHDHALAM